ncbi:MAG: PAS domain S-box protein [Anaerolineales bacterium]|nr:PAS domain S-box protein [Anaerolineales bacterium]
MQSFQYTPYVYPVAIAALLSALLAFYLWDHRKIPGAKPAAVLSLALFVWSFGYCLEILGVELPTKLFWEKIQYFGIVTLPVALFVFSLEYSRRKSWLTNSRLAALLIVPGIALFLAISNDWHQQMWSDWDLETIGGVSILHLEPGIAFWVNSIYTYILLVASTFLILQALIRHPKTYRGQVASMLAGIIAPWLGYAISTLGLFQLPIDLTPLAFAITGLAIAWNIYNYQLQNIAPIAFETVIDSMNDALFILDMENNIVDVNPAGQRTLQRSADEIIGRNARDVFVEYTDLLDLYQHAINIREEIALETDSQNHYYELSISPLTDHQDKILGRAIVLHDISDRKRAENAMLMARDQALEASRAKSHFLARVGHELRTPLGVIRGYADLLKEPAYGALSELQAKAVGEIIDSTQRVSDMVSELLDESRLAAGAVQLEIKPFTPALILKDVQEKLSVLAQQKGLALTSALDPKLPTQLLGDPKRINQMVTNLASNSIKFTKEGEVSVRFYQRSKNQWAMEVTDTGPGIPKKAQEDIFEPFRQADGSIARKYGGTGLGLSIVKHLTGMMDGKITVKSKVGAGSTFTITLPLETQTEKRTHRLP